MDPIDPLRATIYHVKSLPSSAISPGGEGGSEKKRRKKKGKKRRWGGEKKEEERKRGKGRKKREEEKKKRRKGVHAMFISVLGSFVVASGLRSIDETPRTLEP